MESGTCPNIHTVKPIHQAVPSQKGNKQPGSTQGLSLYLLALRCLMRTTSSTRWIPLPVYTLGLRTERSAAATPSTSSLRSPYRYSSVGLMQNARTLGGNGNTAVRE